MPSVVFSRRAKIALAVVGILIVLLILLFNFANIYINFKWFGELGHRNVYSTMLWTKVVLFFIFGVLMALILGANMIVAYRIKPPFRPMSAEQQNLQNYVRMIEPRRRWVLGGVMAIALLAAGASAQGNWQEWQLWLHSTPFHQTDPQFHRDISFYAFDYNVYRTMLGFGFTAIVFALILSVAIHYLTGAIRLQTPGPKVTLAARRHITALVFVFMALKAVAYWFDRYGFVLSGRSKFTGASYADVHAALPAKTILFWITIVLALGVLASMWLRNAILPGIGFVVLLVLSILIGGIYPSIVQHVTVNPNASDKEAPYIERNIRATRDAYGIESRSSQDPNGVHYVNYKATSDPASSAITNTNTTVDNIRLMDPNVISPTVQNDQKIGLPYAFSPVLDVDRYTLPDSTTKTDVEHDYVVAVREQATGSNLNGSQNNWINQHTVYTHGYGFVAAQANEDVTNDAPYTEGGIPPSGPLGITQPDVYYGQLMNDYSIVGAQGKKREFDGNNDPNVSYHGKGGVPLSNWFTKLAFALKYKETNFILNGTVGAKGAKIIFVRNPKSRVQKVAPFLTLDGDPYPIVDKQTGHIVWIVDGYTTSANYPYSERQSLSSLTGTSLRKDQKDTQINYIRNSVKATVDAYDGTVKLYKWDSSDPVLNTWAKVFPGLLKPKSDMPSDIADHVRYPQDFFNVQRALITQYHISNPQASYNGKGKWAVAPDPFETGQNQPAYYVLARDPGSSSNTPEFQLTSPLVVNNSSNLAAYMSVDSDPDHYGRITVLQLPGGSAYLGPGQVANDLKSTGVISKDIQQLDNGQSRVVHGNLLTLPVGNAFLYVEPLYVQSSAAGASTFPTLQRVLVRYGGNVGYGETLDAALGDLQTGRPAGSTVPGANVSGSSSTGSGGTKSSTAPSSSSPPSSSSSAPPTTSAPGQPTSTPQVNADLDTAYDQLQAAYKTGDPVKVAQAQKKIQDLLAILRGLPKPSATK